MCVVRLLFVVTYSLFAQNWTSQDSLRLRQVLNDKEELKLNLDALKELKNQSLWGIQKVSANKPWMDYDETLPEVPRVSPYKVRFTLYPYTANTRYNWDPVYQKKITINKDTWRGNPFYALSKLPVYSGSSPSGKDFMTIFTKEFWSPKARRRRARTLELLKAYGDSTTIMIKNPVFMMTN